MNQGVEQVASRIGRDVVLASLDPLARVIATRPAGRGGRDRLAVDDACGRFHLPALCHPHPGDQNRVDRVEQATVAHPVEMILHRRGRREVPGQRRLPPARRRKVLDRVPKIPCPVQPRAPHLRRSDQQRRNSHPLRIGAVACVAQPSPVMFASSGFGPAHRISGVFASPGESRLTQAWPSGRLVIGCGFFGRPVYPRGGGWRWRRRRGG